MWKLKDPDKKSARLDFYNCGQSIVPITQLWDGDIQLVNAIEYTNWDEAEIQVLVCKECGNVGCESGGWIEVKRTDSMAIVMPCFTAIKESSGWFQDYYFPPDYLASQGVIYVDRDDYTNTLCQMAPFPKFETLPKLTAWEALQIVQLEAPRFVLGYLFNRPQLQSDIIVASSEGNFIEQTQELLSTIATWQTSDRAVNFRPVGEGDRIITFYLDMSGFPEWQVLSYNGDRCSLYLDPGYVVE